MIIVTMVVLGVGIYFWQSYRSQQAAEQLWSSVIPTATVRPASYFAFLIAVTLTYLVLVDVANRQLARWLGL